VDFTIPEELTQLRQSYATFVDREVRPVDERFHAELARWEWTEGMAEAARGIRRRSAEEGFYACYLPEEVGGWGLTTLGTTLLVEDTGASGSRSATWALGPPNPEAPSPVLLDAQPHIRERYLAPLVTAEATMCFALTEPEAGSDAQNISTRAEKRGDTWVLNGTKHYITGADDADIALVFAVNDHDKRAHGGITAFIVPRDRYEVVSTQWTVADTHPYEIVLDDAEVGEDHVVGEVGFGFYTAMRFLNAGRAYIGASCLGMAQFCLDHAIEHARSRTAFGKPIGKNQAVSFPLADSKVEIEAARWLTYNLAWQVDEAVAGDGEAPGGNIMLDSSIVKLYGTEMVGLRGRPFGGHLRRNIGVRPGGGRGGAEQHHPGQCDGHRQHAPAAPADRSQKTFHHPIFHPAGTAENRWSRSSPARYVAVSSSPARMRYRAFRASVSTSAALAACSGVPAPATCATAPMSGGISARRSWVCAPTPSLTSAQGSPSSVRCSVT
jgi:acyl-CoA dehydrogenase